MNASPVPIKKSTAPIHLLPVELLQQIFLFYYQDTNSPLLLLFICRFWHLVALDTPTLWSTVRFAPYATVGSCPLNQKIHAPYTCYTFEQLDRMAERTKTAMLDIHCELFDFDLELSLLFSEQDPRSLNPNTFETQLREGWVSPLMQQAMQRQEWIQTRCKSLHVIHKSGTFDHFVTMFRHVPALEMLEIEGGPVGDMKSFLSNVAQSPMLSTLRIGSSIPENCFGQGLLDQIQILQVPAVVAWMRPLEMLVSRCTGLRSLQVFGTDPNAPTSTLFSGIAPILEAPLYTGGYRYNARPVLNHLLHLAIYGQWHRCHDSPRHPMELPRLKTLEILGCHGLERIRAPVLERLRMEHVMDVWRPNQMTLRPRSLTIDDSFRTHTFQQMLETTWSKLQEIHLIDHDPSTESFAALVQVLTQGNAINDKWSQPVCSGLRILSVLTKSDARRVNYARLESRKKTLEEVVQKRREIGFDELRDVRCGWRYTKGGTINVEDWLAFSV